MIQSESVIETMIQYMISVLEQPHPVFGNLPICPFAHRARVQNLIQFHVDAFGFEDLHDDSRLMKMIHSFKAQTQFELLFVIHPDQTAMSVEELDHFTDRLCHTIHPLNLLAYGGHPKNSFNINGVFTRQEPWRCIIKGGVEGDPSCQPVLSATRPTFAKMANDGASKTIFALSAIVSF